MASFHNSPELSDLVIRCGTEVLFVHRFALSLASPVFRNMFKTVMKEKQNRIVTFEDIDIKILRLVIQWIYTGSVQVVDRQSQIDLYKAAHKYQIDSLKNWCISQIRKGILKMFPFGELYEESMKMKNAFELIKSNKVFSHDESKEWDMQI